MNSYYIKLSLIILVLNLGNLFAQTTNETPKVILDKVKINGKILTPNEIDGFVISKNDSLNLTYHLQMKQSLRTPFIFKILLKNDQDESFLTTNQTSITYKSLPENNYQMTVEAFDPQNRWTAETVTIRFKVNNREAGLLQEIRELKSNSVLKDSLLKENTGISDFGINFSSVLIGFAICAIFASVGFIFLKKNYDSTEKYISKNIKDDNMPKESTVSQDQFDKILLENSNLRAEISTLRGQIDALQTRADEMRKQNRELQDNFDRVQKSKKDLEELQTQKDDLFAIVVHDIKNPAALIKNLVELLRSYDLTAVEQQEVINDIVHTTQKIVALSQDVTKILALESNVLKLNYEMVSINDIVVDVSRRYQNAASSKNIELLLELTDNLPDVNIDIQKFDEVVENLVSNGIKFSPKNSTVKIITKKTGDYLQIDVSDNGYGLSQEDVSRAFQRGAQLSARPTGDESSSGFGLWIVKKLIEAHQGKVWIKSTLGKGSTFSVSVPIKQDNDK